MVIAVAKMKDETTMEKNKAIVTEIVTKIIVEHLGIDSSKVVNSANVVKDLGADSLDTVELVMVFEDKFQIEIPDAEVEKMLTVGDIVKYLEAHPR